MNQTDMLTDMRDVFDTANRQNTSIYAVDPRGLAAVEYGINEGVTQTIDRDHLNSSLDTLRTLAGNTDGRAIINRNDLAVGMKQIIRDSSGYYLLGYNSTQAPTDGKFHEIKVRVSRRGVDVRARKGYWALSPEDAARVAAPPKPEAPAAVTAALNSLAEPERGRPAKFWVGTSRGDNGQTRVTFSWEAIAPPPGSIERTAPAARIALDRERERWPAAVQGARARGRRCQRCTLPGAVRAGGRRLGRTCARSRRIGAVRRAARPGGVEDRGRRHARGSGRLGLA